MKKVKIVHKKQITLAVMVLGLAAAVWLNMKYTATNGGFSVGNTSSNRILGQAEYVGADADENEGTLAVGSDSYFETARAERETSRKDQTELLQETIADVKIDDSAKAAAVDGLAVLTKRTENETAIETLIKAKGMPDSIAVIGDEGISVMIKGDSLLDSEVQQIKDIVIGQTGIGIEKIKIMAVK